ncbi:MAG: 50S ribosomal protein L13 [Deltaproteobacteria bacterium]|nr:50S ribosomal protein L13 [Deltaproteobacteria bacterium]
MTQNRKTYSAKKGEVERAWHVVDVDGKTLGRAATQIAQLLRGKHKPTFTPHVDMGDFVIVINAHKVRLTGKKLTDKLYRDHSLFPGGLKTKTAEQMLAKHPEELVKRAVWGMLPKGPLGRKLYRKLKVYAAAEHPHEAQQPQAFQV